MNLVRLAITGPVQEIGIGNDLENQYVYGFYPQWQATSDQVGWFHKRAIGRGWHNQHHAYPLPVPRQPYRLPMTGVKMAFLSIDGTVREFGVDPGELICGDRPSPGNALQAIFDSKHLSEPM
jgi:hypothetical protein